MMTTSVPPIARRFAYALVLCGAMACDVDHTAAPLQIPVEVAGISNHLRVGDSTQLQARNGASAVLGVASSVLWSTSNANVARISRTGLVTALAVGDAIITAEDGITTMSVRVTVVPAGGLTSLINADAQGNPLARFDVEGNAIDLHGGEVHQFDGLYYWYGEHYACGFQWLTPGTPFCGFKVYTSPDLVRWTHRGNLFDVTPYWQLHCGGQTDGCFRPHVAYNALTKRYVAWVNAYDAQSGYFVFESETPTGPFVEQKAPALAVGRVPLRGDGNLFVDDDGTGYLVYTNHARDGDLVVERLATDYLSGTGDHVELGLAHVESPSLFKREGRYYITFSDPNCGYCGTGTSYMTAPSPLGPWSGRRSISATSCGGQPTHVSRFVGTGGSAWYMYQSDLWNSRELNQATAGQFWGALTFDVNGKILLIDCEHSADAPVLANAALSTDASAEDSADRYRTLCDIGADGGATQRELRFTSQRAGRLRSIVFNTFQRGARNSPEGGSPNAPLVVELRTSPAGQVLARAELPPSAVDWSARQHTVALDAPVVAGADYAVRLSSASSRGCYGLAYRDDLGTGLLKSLYSGTAGLLWTAEPWRMVKAEVLIQ